MMGSWLNIVIGTTLFQVLSSQGRDEGTRGIEKNMGRSFISVFARRLFLAAPRNYFACPDQLKAWNRLNRN